MSGLGEGVPEGVALGIALEPFSLFILRCRFERGAAGGGIVGCQKLV